MNQTIQQTPRLEIRKLMRSFEGRRVVDDVSLSILPGQVTCLLGPSGCGKSTTLRMIAGVEMQDSGEIYVDGKLICDTIFRVPPERREIGLMFQDFALFPHLSVAANVAYGLRGAAAEKDARVDEMLARIHMSGHKGAFPHQLSGGEQQRVALARALAPKPRIMLMDEPFAAVDDLLRSRLNEELIGLWQQHGWTTVFVTHHVHEAVFLSQRVLIMSPGPGRIVDEVKIDLPYPRSAEMRGSAEFAAIAHDVIQRLHQSSETGSSHPIDRAGDHIA